MKVSILENTVSQTLFEIIFIQNLRLLPLSIFYHNRMSQKTVDGGAQQIADPGTLAAATCRQIARC